MGEKGGLMDNTLVVVLLLIGLTINCADGEFDDPRKNVNLAPWQKWENANQCLLNITSDCSTKYTLTYKGWMNLTAADTDPYCKSGCKDHTWVVLDCVNLMKHDYEFQDFSTTQTIRDTIKQGCSSKFSGKAVLPAPNAGTKHGSSFITYVAAMAVSLYIYM